MAERTRPALASRDYFLWQNCLQGSLVKRTNSQKETLATRNRCVDCHHSSRENTIRYIATTGLAQLWNVFLLYPQCLSFISAPARPPALVSSSTFGVEELPTVCLPPPVRASVRLKPQGCDLRHAKCGRPKSHWGPWSQAHCGREAVHLWESLDRWRAFFTVRLSPINKGTSFCYKWVTTKNHKWSKCRICGCGVDISSTALTPKAQGTSHKRGAERL